MSIARRCWASTMVLVCMFSILVTGCTEVSSSPSEPAAMVDSGSWYSREQWPHDGNPYESQNLQVYSDASSQAARREVAEIGEELLTDLIEEFEIQDGMFRFPDGQGKIHVYAYRDRFPQAWGARGYYGGLIIWSLDHERRSTDRDIYRAVFEHELVHVVESLLKGRFVGDVPVAMRVHVWFSEGLAEAVVGGTSGGAIRDREYLNELVEEYGRISPVAIRTDDQMGNWEEEQTQMAAWYYYYPMFQLAVEYLLDEDGLGRSPQDATLIFVDMADGADFETAFENRMGISLEGYEEQFFDLMFDYLAPDPVDIWLGRALVGWLALTATSLVVLVWFLARGTTAGWGIKLAWVFATLLFGPFGLLAFFSSRRRLGLL